VSDAANVMVYVGIPKGQADQEEGNVPCVRGVFFLRSAGRSFGVTACVCSQQKYLKRYKMGMLMNWQLSVLLKVEKNLELCGTFMLRKIQRRSGNSWKR